MKYMLMISNLNKLNILICKQCIITLFGSYLFLLAIDYNIIYYAFILTIVSICTGN